MRTGLDTTASLEASTNRQSDIARVWQNRSFHAFDTQCFLKASVPQSRVPSDDKSEVPNPLDKAVQLCFRYERLWSHTLKGSDIWHINHAKGAPVEVHPETARILQLAQHYSSETAGLFNPMLAPVAELWNFRNATVPNEREVKRALNLAKRSSIEVAGTSVRLPHPESRLSLGGIAKGYIADQVRMLFQECGVNDALINLGGNIVVMGTPLAKPFWRVGIRSPRHHEQQFTALTQAEEAARSPHGMDRRALANRMAQQAEQPVCTLAVSDCSIVTSSIYERCFRAENGQLYHHIVDPRTGYPAETDLASATVISKRSIDGDGLSTALLIMGSTWAKNYLEGYPEAEGIFITKEGEILTTSGVEELLIP